MTRMRSTACLEKVIKIVTKDFYQMGLETKSLLVFKEMIL